MTERATFEIRADPVAAALGFLHRLALVDRQVQREGLQLKQSPSTGAVVTAPPHDTTLPCMDCFKQTRARGKARGAFLRPSSMRPAGKKQVGMKVHSPPCLRWACDGPYSSSKELAGERADAEECPAPLPSKRRGPFLRPRVARTSLAIRTPRRSESCQQPQWPHSWPPLHGSKRPGARPRGRPVRHCGSRRRRSEPAFKCLVSTGLSKAPPVRQIVTQGRTDSPQVGNQTMKTTSETTCET